jgi:hypothetical protein
MTVSRHFTYRSRSSCATDPIPTSPASFRQDWQRLTSNASCHHLLCDVLGHEHASRLQQVQDFHQQLVNDWIVKGGLMQPRLIFKRFSQIRRPFPPSVRIGQVRYDCQGPWPVDERLYLGDRPLA